MGLYNVLSFTSGSPLPNICEIHVCCNMHQYFIPFQVGEEYAHRKKSIKKPLQNEKKNQ